MSELTRCNFCSLEDMRARAARRGATIALVRHTDGEMAGWWEATSSDDHGSAWFMELTEGCVC